MNEIISILKLAIFANIVYLLLWFSEYKLDMPILTTARDFIKVLMLPSKMITEWIVNRYKT